MASYVIMTSASTHATEASAPAHYTPVTMSDRMALRAVKLLRAIADAFFHDRYLHRAVVLEAIAAVPGMVGGALNHLRCLRRIENDHGWIKTLLDEAENERMHLMTFAEMARPTWFERALLIAAQGVFFNIFFLFYMCSRRTAHRFVGYLEEEAVVSYTAFLADIDAGKIENRPAPEVAVRYWDLPRHARLRDVVIVVREDEAGHRDVNHGFADDLRAGRD